MGKSIIVIDTPEKCLDCPCHFTGMIRLNPSGKERFIPILCGINDRDIMSDEDKPDWCPLCEIPAKMQFNEQYPDAIESFAHGYNAAISEILGE